jgi:predicted ATPase
MPSEFNGQTPAPCPFALGRVVDLGCLAHGLLRSLKAAELSDGTLRYFLLISALLSPRPPTLMILNEPETSLHQDLLARWRGRAAV